MSELVEERRGAARLDWYEAATVDLGDGGTIDCLIEELSVKGARLGFIDPDQLPDSFALYVAAPGELPRRCKIVWRGIAQVGVEFVPAA